MKFPIIAVAFFNGLMVTACSLIVDAILDLRHSFPRWSLAFKINAFFGVLLAFAGIWGGNTLTGAFILGLISFTGIMAMVLSIMLAIKKEMGAILFFISFSSLLIPSVPIILRNIGFIDPNFVLPYAQHLGVICQSILLSLGVMQQTRATEKARHIAQQTLLTSAWQAERQLEERIEHRTRALAKANAALADEVIERRQIEDLLREGEQKMRELLDAAPFPMMVSAHDTGHVLFANTPATDLLGLGSEHIIGQPIQSFYKDYHDWQKITERLSLSNPVLNSEVCLLHDGKHERWVIVSAVPLRYANQPAMLSCFNDISARKDLEISLRHAREQAENALETERRARREQRNFLAMVSHEFRVPLAIVETSAQILNLILPPDRADTFAEVAKLQRAVGRMTDLIETCLADEWLDSTSMTLRLETLDLVWMVQDVCEEFTTLVSTQRMRLSLPETAIFQGDATLIRVVISNLVDNAIKYSPQFSPIDISIENKDNIITLEVSDQGAGIPADEREQIFDKFFRSPSVGRVGGAGLGLYVVRKIVAQHQGSIVCASGKNGIGTVFRVTLPPLHRP